MFESLKTGRGGWLLSGGGGGINGGGGERPIVLRPLATLTRKGRRAAGSGKGNGCRVL